MARPRLRKVLLVTLPEPTPASAQAALRALTSTLFEAAALDIWRPIEGANAGTVYTALRALVERRRYDAVLLLDSPKLRSSLPVLSRDSLGAPVVVVELAGLDAGPAPSRRRALPEPPAQAWCFGKDASEARAAELLPLEVLRAPAPTRAFVEDSLSRLGRARAPRPRALSSIVIPCWNGLAYTKACLRSVLTRTDGPFEVVVVDNGSTDGTARFVRSLEDRRVRLVRNRENLGFAKAVNQGLRQARGRYAVWLNNDAVVTHGWLGRLVAALERAPWIGAVGPYTNEAVGLQHLQDVSYGGLQGLPAFAAAWSLKRAGRLAWAHRLIGFCLAHRLSVVEQIGGLDERFGLGCYEDFDFCLRLRQAGYELFIAEDVFIHHHGHKTFEGNDLGHLEQARRNREVFIDKWCRLSLSALDNADALLTARPDLSAR